MGTNYYHETNICECCQRCDVTHIGKSSYGWMFTFHGTDTIRSWAEWKEALKSGRIRDEYGELVTAERFGELVEAKRSEQLNHTLYCRNEHPAHAERNCWLDPEGHPFSSSEFS